MARSMNSFGRPWRDSSKNPIWWRKLHFKHSVVFLKFSLFDAVNAPVICPTIPHEGVKVHHNVTRGTPVDG